MKPCTIAIDAMGGDYGPEVIVPASLNMLRQHKHLSLILVGDEGLLAEQLKGMSSCLRSRCQIYHTSQHIEMDDPPLLALRSKQNSSMYVAISLVKQGKAQACVSAGNTGALVAIAYCILKTLPGIDRPAITTLFPTINPTRKVRLLDLGANVDVSTEHLFQFAVMGLVLASEVNHITKPKLALLNIGTEVGKGNAQIRKAEKLFSEKGKAINYQGYIEGSTLFDGEIDVVVCDGFIGNIALKMSEGVAKLVTTVLKQHFKQDRRSKLAGFIARPVVRSAYKRLDPGRHNGASLVGLQGIVIKSHGSATYLSFMHAIEEAMSEIEQAVPDRIREKISAILQPTPQS